MAAFDLNFSVDGGYEMYISVIEGLRNQLAVGNRIQGVPSLPPEVSNPEELQFFDVNLSYAEYVPVQVRFRTDNLYLVGYRPRNSNTWYELRHNGGTLIHENGTTTQILSFGENYNDMTRAAKLGLDRVQLNSSSIGNAIRDLAMNTSDQESIARAILTLTYFIAEAARFKDISSLVQRVWWWQKDSEPGHQYANRVRSWAKLSAAVQRTRNAGHSFDFDGGGTGITTLDQAIESLGIMHTKASPSTGMASDREVLAWHTPYAQGQPLLEIFYIWIRAINIEMRGKLYGTITVTDSAGTEVIWERDHRHYIHIQAGEDILLEGPSRALSAADEFYINIDLNDDYSNATVAKETIIFDPFDYYTKSDVVNSHDTTSGNGSATICYMAIADGLHATICIVLTDVDDKHHADVYGGIIVDNGHAQSQLFRRARDDSVHVKRQHQIPLSKALAAVPTHGALLVNARLIYRSPDDWDDELASGQAEFQPRYNKSEKKFISGACGKIEIHVSWK
ncbi:hypothetical protein VTH82DRAFT_6794 [Thermothelomyces myriococcoides]